MCWRRCLGLEKRITVAQINFSVAFDRVRHSGFQFKLRDVGVGVVFNVIAGLLSGRVQRAVVGGIHRENVRVISGVSHGSELGPLLFLLYTSDLPIILENTLGGYADDSTLLTELPEISNRVQAVLSLNRDLTRIGDWCKRWKLLANPMISKALLIST